LSGAHGFLGPNGAGKTTTIKMLLGLLHITEGKALIRGYPAGSLNARKLIGFLPQNPDLYDYMSGEEFLIFMGRLGNLKKREAKYRAQKLLTEFDMVDARDRRVGNYSGGMKQKIGLASALIHQPKLLILDEPTANLDPLGRQEIIDKINSLREDISIFVSSHVLSEVEQICDYVTIISNGKLLFSDLIEEIKKKFKRNLYILDTNKNKRLVPELRKKDYVKEVWIDDKDQQIYILPSDVGRLERNITKLVGELNAIQKKFTQPDLSLQEMFLKIISPKSKKDKNQGEEIYH
jgi:ABC-2 type transport system ATP-binding protein